MSLLSLPDILGMLVLIAVLGWFRQQHEDKRVDGWMMGLYFILVEMIAASIIHGSKMLPVVMHVISLNAYVLAAVTFGWEARRRFLPIPSHRLMYLLASLPMSVLATMFGLGLSNSFAYTAIAALSLIGGMVYLLAAPRQRRSLRGRMLVVHLVVWAPMFCFAIMHQTGWVLYWGLACLYLLVAVSFRSQLRPSLGSWVIVVSFAIWAMCFLATPLASAHPVLEGAIEQIWNIQKFFVVIGMLLVLLEDEIQLRKNEAMHDALTGLPNRRLFEDRLEVAFKRSRRTGLSAGVFVIDLHGFKSVNDTYGHKAGDIVLTRVADRLKRKVRGADTVARCGGDEFMVIVNDLTRPENCQRIASALRTAIEAVEIPGSNRARMSGSIGWALFPEDSEDREDLCQVADFRMYEEKREAHAGRMRV